MRTLALGLGNSSLIGGVFDNTRLIRSFRRAPHQRPLVRGRFDAVALCSVVPTRTPDLVAWCETQLGLTPRVLTARAAHGLTLGYREPHRLGTDRLAAAIGARALHPGKNVVVVDCGTATTVTALRRDGHLLGGAILPGLSLWGDALAARTAQLPRVAPSRPRRALGRSPAQGIASGTYFGHLGAVREVVARVAAEAFGRQRFIVMGTGGHAPALHGEGLFTEHEPVLVLRGLQAFAARDFS
jgi:type III pantothenate kinase